MLLLLFHLCSSSLKLATAYKVSTINPNSGMEAETKWNLPEVWTQEINRNQFVLQR